MAQVQCSTDGCGEPRKGKSKYCKVHRALARKAWKTMITKSSDERDARYELFAIVWSEVSELMTDNDLPGGFVRISPANTSFAHWVRNQGYAQRRHGQGGLFITVNRGAQTLAEGLATRLTDIEPRVRVAFSAAA